ncbi:hypothetical protein pb186bvf_003810 [Paramecium bursaria]
MHEMHHIRILQDFSELILNDRIQGRKVKMHNYELLGIEQMRGNFDDLIQQVQKGNVVIEIRHRSKKQKPQLAEVWILNTTRDCFRQFSPRMVKIQARSLLSYMGITPLHSQKQLEYRIGGMLNVPKQFKRVDFPVIPCGNWAFHLRLFYDDSPSQQMIIIPKQVETVSEGHINEIIEHFKQQQSTSLQIYNTLEYFN